MINSPKRSVQIESVATPAPGTWVALYDGDRGADIHPCAALAVVTVVTTTAPGVWTGQRVVVGLAGSDLHRTLCAEECLTPDATVIVAESWEDANREADAWACQRRAELAVAVTA